MRMRKILRHRKTSHDCGVQVIALCEKLAGADAKVTQVPVWLLRTARRFLSSFQWARDAAERLVRP